MLCMCCVPGVYSAGQLLWRVVASFLGLRTQDPRMQSVREFLALMSRRSGRAASREVEKLLPLLAHDRDLRRTAMK